MKEKGLLFQGRSKVVRRSFVGRRFDEEEKMDRDRRD